MTSAPHIVGRSHGVDLLWLEEPFLVGDEMVVSWSDDVGSAWELPSEVAAITVALWLRGSTVEVA